MSEYYGCRIMGFKPSPATLDVLESIDRLSGLSKLKGILVGASILQMFSGRTGGIGGVGTATAGINITGYDWMLLHDAVKSISKLQKKTAGTRALYMVGMTYGKEKEFWECMYNVFVK